MRTGRHLKIDSGDWEYLAGETNHSFPLNKETYLVLKIHSDKPVQTYLINSQSNIIHPLGEFDKFERNLHVIGFDTLTIKCSKSTKLAVLVTASTRADLDPLDYEPVKIDAPVRDLERLMMAQILDEKLRDMGIDPDATKPSEDDDEDLDFFDEEPQEKTTIHEQFEIDQNAQLERDLDAIDKHVPVETSSSSHQQKDDPSPTSDESKDSKDESEQ